MTNIKKIFIGIGLCGLGSFLFCSGVKEPAAPPPIANQSASFVAPAKLFAWVGDRDYKSPKDTQIENATLVNQSQGLASDWYKDSSFYHIWVKSFYDYDGDGIGDFRGITAKLDYIKNEVGCDAIWLSPIFDCAGKGTSVSSNMHGYDTVDYYNVNDYFGNMEHLEELLREAHARGMKVIFDFVPNHTSNLHPWFLQSAKRENNKDTWYLWNQERLSWNPMGNSTTWFNNYERQEFYYGAFNLTMPDLNFRNYEVREEMKNVVRFWLNKGFDGLRIDAVRYLIEDAGSAGLVDTQATHEWYEELRSEVIDEYAKLGKPKFMVCEAWIQNDRSRLNRYFGDEAAPEFNMVFDFDFTGKLTMAVRYKNRDFVSYVQNDLAKRSDQRYGVFLSNHDNVANRPGSTFKTQEELRLATAVSLLLPATPFIYYGNEIGQQDQSNLQGQDLRLRYPLRWDEAERQQKDSSSLLSLHKTLLGLRQTHEALRFGRYVPLGGDRILSSVPTSVLAYTLFTKGETIVCVFNMDSEPIVNLDFDVSGLFDKASVKKAQLLYTSDDALSVGVENNTLRFVNIENRGFAVIKLE